MVGPFFDTNIVIDWLKRIPSAVTELKRYERHRISRIVWAEVLAGEDNAARTLVTRALSHFEIVEIDSRIALAAADIRHRTRMKLLDAMILATAQAHGAILVTRNTKDFPSKMLGIRVPYTL